MNILDSSFYMRDTVTVAHDLLGKKVVSTIDGIVRSGIIVETEAYCASDDAASHAYNKKTQRNAPMFGQVGCAYVYFIYGNYYCFNIVARDMYAHAGAVLIRALEPCDGIVSMHMLRKTDNIYALTSGPGKLAMALGISKKHNGISLIKEGSLYVIEDQAYNQFTICQTKRIGITKAQQYPWRFYVHGNCWVSRYS